MIKITMDGDTEVMRMLETAPDRVIGAFLHASEQEAEALAVLIRENAAGGVLESRTGTLAESVQPDAPKIDGLQSTVGVSSDVYYGLIQEVGIRNPFPEEAHGSAMMFEEGGEQIFRKLVEHPAMPEHPWFTPVLDSQAPQIMEAAERAIQEELGK